MTQIILIHCRSCGEDCTASWATPHQGHPIMRCGKCRSLNFRVIETVDVEEEHPADYDRLVIALQANVQESVIQEVENDNEKSV